MVHRAACCAMTGGDTLTSQANTWGFKIRGTLKGGYRDSIGLSRGYMGFRV